MKSDRIGATLGRTVTISRDVMDALWRAQEALQADSNEEEHEALLVLVKALDEALVGELRYEAHGSFPSVSPQDKAMKHESATDLKLVIPTYNGKWIEEYPDLEDFDEPHVPVLITRPDGVRIVLGTHDHADFNKPEIQFERRHNGWMIFLQPQGAGETSGFVVFLDNGRSYVAPEGPQEWEISMVDYEEAIAELDGIKPPGPSCAPTAIIERERKKC